MRIPLKNSAQQMAPLLAAVVLGTTPSPAQQLDLSALPVLDRPPASVDWLVRQPERGARAYRSADGRELVLDNGLVRRVWRTEPNGACVAFDNRMTGESILRAVRPEARVELDGVRYEVGGLVGQPNHAFLTPAWLEEMEAAPGAMRLVGFEVGETVERFPWKRVRHCAPDVAWPPPGVALRLDFALPELQGKAPEELPDEESPADLREQYDELRKIRVAVHYELYDGVPVMAKWITVHNGTQQAVTVDRFASEILAVVEHASWVETREGTPQAHPRGLQVETDFAFGGMVADNANRHVVHWRTDPQYSTQVSYLRQNPCLLEVEPTYGPAQTIEPGGIFESQRTFELVHDSTDRERRGLARRRMYRTVAPWVTENPLMMHMRTADPEKVRGAIEQCALVGFEMLILSFGSGFNIEDESEANLEKWREVADYAHSRGIEIGGYSLLSSRRIGGGNDVVSPEGKRPTHGNCPAVTSEWGQNYYRKLYQFFERTGFDLLEHDGPYPGDVDVTPRPPLQKGEADSRWVQWRIASGFYEWCRGQGIYVNAPDYYYLSGSTKCGMGYREANWSLPRAQQVIHTRQNIFDGTWHKTPSMGWMFVPLTQYHGGGAAATIEPLDEHLDHYRRMMDSNLALGVQACYRGPRLYDTDRTKELVRERVAWFKAHRDILESDLIHGRRADGRDLDWMLHVNPRLRERGLLVVFNPLGQERTKTLKVDLYYTGLTDSVLVRPEGREGIRLPLARDYTIQLDSTAPAGGMTWYCFEE